MRVKKAKNIALIGFQSCGKSTLGRALACQENRPFVDIDIMIQQHHPSMYCREIYTSYGEGYFRDIESHEILQLESLRKLSIIATGGGVLMRQENALSLKKHALLIYIKRSPSLLKNRLMEKKQPPAYLMGGEIDLQFDQIFLQRSADYEKWADYTLDLQDNLSVDESLMNLYSLIKSEGSYGF